MGLRIAFMGSPDFAVPALKALVTAGHDVVAVYSQPPRPAGRGQAVRPGPVHAAALGMGLDVRTPERLRKDMAAQAAFAALELDVAIVAAYGLILPQAMLDAPRLGCLNIHASLLPRWRGAAPIQAALLAGDAESGITIMQMEAGLDTGPMLLREAVEIGPRMTAPELHDVLAAMGARMVVSVLNDPPPPVAQPADGATYAARLARDDGQLDWSRNAAALDRQIRALNPWPGTFCSLGAEVFKIHAADIADGRGAPGEVLDNALLVACGDHALRLTRVQAPGRAALPAAEFLRGRPIPRGSHLA